jgi:hypothetical protein
MKSNFLIIIFSILVFRENVSYCQDFSIVKHEIGYNIVQIDGTYHLEYLDSSFLYENIDTICNALNTLYDFYKKSNIALPRFLKLVKFNINGPGTVIDQLGAFDVEKSTYMYYKARKNKLYHKKIKLRKCIPNSQ